MRSDVKCFGQKLNVLLDAIYLQSESVSKISDMNSKEIAVSLRSRAIHSHA